MPNGTPAPIPGWVNQAAALVTQVGVPTVFAAVLLWFVLTHVQTTLETIEANEMVRTTLLRETQEAFVGALHEQTAEFKTAIREAGEANRTFLLERLRTLEQRPAAPVPPQP